MLYKKRKTAEKLWRAQIREVHCADQVSRYKKSMYISGLAAKSKEFGK